MKNVNYIIKAAIVFLFVLFTMVSAHAQVGPCGGIGGGVGDPGGPGSGAPGSPGVPQDNAVPFDGGLSLILLAAGAGLAKKKRTAQNI